MNRPSWLSACFAVVLSASASATEMSDVHGLEIAGVSLVAPRGGLPDESLEPLLRARQGEMLSARSLQLDVTTLFRVGEFSAVEADVKDWFAYEEDGTLKPAVLVTYLVYPAPRIARVRLQGHRALRQREILDAAAITNGEVFYPELENARLAERVRLLYRSQGFPDTEVEVDPEIDDQGDVELWIRIREGDPTMVDSLEFEALGSETLPISKAQLRRWTRAAGVRQSKPTSEEAILAAQQRLREEMASTDKGWFRRQRGWIEARVQAVPVSNESGLQVTFLIDPGRRLDLKVSGMGLRGNSVVRDTLRIDDRLRLTRGFEESAPRELTTHLENQGYLNASVDVTVESTAETQVLRVDVNRGPRHRVRRLEFEGNEGVSEQDLRMVMSQSSDSLRMRYFSDAAIKKGVQAATDLYRAQGYLEAQLEVARQRLRPGFNLLHLGPRRPRNATIWFAVIEGPLTHLEALTLTLPKGVTLDGVDLDFMETEKARLVGAPLSPRDIDELAKRVATALRNSGYLDADARVSYSRGDNGPTSANIHVEPGDQILLRSVVTRGLQTTRRRLILREVETDLGTPITEPALRKLSERLYDLGIFRSVRPEILGDDYARDLMIMLEERPRWGFEAGTGLSTDQGIRVFGRVTRRNLWGFAHKVDAYGTVGLDWRGRTLADWVPDVLAPEWRAGMSYSAPRFPVRGQTLVFDLLLQERLQEPTWRIARSGLGLSLDTTLRRVLFRVSARTELRQLLQVEQGSLIAGEVWEELVGGQDLPTRWRPHEALSALLLLDYRDNPISPSEGVVTSLLTEYSPGFAIDDVPGQAYIKAEARASGWVPLSGPVLHLSAEVGRGFPIGGGVMPLEDRYRLGGTGSMRGFWRDGVGPRNLTDRMNGNGSSYLQPAMEVALRDDPERWVPTGGDTRVLGVIELHLPFPVLGLRSWDGWSASLFCDVGNVWLLGKHAEASSERSETREIFDPFVRFGVGAGLRIDTPVGPVRLDVGLNPTAMAARDARRELLVEQWEEPYVTVHVALGAL